MLRTLIVWLMVAAATIVAFPLVILTFPFDRQGKLIWSYGRWWGRLHLLTSGIKVEIKGLENINWQGSQVFMANHQGVYDIFVLLTLPHPFRWIAKKELFRIPFFGWCLSLTGSIAIDRRNREDAIKSLELAAKKIREGSSVMIFPEGTRTPDGSVQPFKKGGFVLAIKSQVPIVPVTIIGSQKIMPKGKFKVQPGKIKVIIDQPIPTVDLELKDREALIQKVRETIIKNLANNREL